MSYGEFAANAKFNGYFQFNGNANDFSGNGYNLSTNGTTSYQPGRFGSNSFSISAVTGSAYLSSAMGIPATKTQPITLSAWFYPTSLPPSSGDQRYFIFRFANGAAGVGGPTYDALYNYNGGAYQLQLRYADWQVQSLNYVVTLAINTWHHLAYTFGDGGNYMSMYVNGRYINRVLIATGGSGTGSQHFVVGNGGVPNYANGFQGRIDEHILQAVAWPSQQIRRYYDVCMNRYTPRVAI